MKRRRLLILPLLGACAADQTATPTAVAVATVVAPPSPPIASVAPPPPVTPPFPAPFGAAYRQLLAQLVSVDTSHGHETTLLEPIAALYRDAGVSVQILESSNGRP